MTAANRVMLAPGLYLVSTPIGTARDITLRCLDILASADVLAAEDTRSLRRLMDIHGIALDGRRIIAYHDHNGDAVRPVLLNAVAEGRSVAYASEAGTPMIADPGYQLGRAMREAGHDLTAAPGPSAVITALTLSGLPTDQFFFAGFAPNTQSGRRKFLERLVLIETVCVLYESPKRLRKLLADIETVYGADHEVVVARELTKKFEEILNGPVATLTRNLSDRTIKGEIVVLIARGQKTAFSSNDLEEMLRDRLKNDSLKTVVDGVARETGLKRRLVYQTALGLGK